MQSDTCSLRLAQALVKVRDRTSSQRGALRRTTVRGSASKPITSNVPVKDRRVRHKYDRSIIQPLPKHNRVGRRDAVLRLEVTQLMNVNGLVHCNEVIDRSDGAADLP